MSPINRLNYGLQDRCSSSAQEPTQDNIEVFDFKKNWHLVKPHLHNPKVQNALLEGLNAYLENRRASCVAKGLSTELLQGPWTLEEEPWAHATDYWDMQVEEMAEMAGWEWNLGEDDDEDAEELENERYREFCSKFWPKPGSYQWYQLPYGSHWLAPWQRELGRLMFPQFEWHILSAPPEPLYFHNYSVVYCLDQDRRVRMLLDIWNFEGISAAEMVESAGGFGPEYPFNGWD